MHPHNSGSTGRFLLKFCTMKGAKVDENDINNFPKKIFVWGKWTILGPKMAHPHNSGSAVRIFCKFCSMKKVNR